ncbi:MAG TPA: N-acetylmuramoyl-L-alanine amidase [Vicinamibacterales bacterium]|nr:N-acetylmuramoyl-L-alanine amidase [Vicinamibacterales bacterium]
MKSRTGAVLMAAVVVMGGARATAAQTAEALYNRALGQERVVRDAEASAALKRIRGVIAAYQQIVHRYPKSGYSDNALWQAGHLALLAYERFGEEADRKTGIRLFTLLASEYPASSLVPRVREAIATFDTVRRPAAPRRAVSRPRAPDDVPAEASESDASGSPDALVTIRSITRTRIPDGVRVSIEMDRELLFQPEQLESPRRLFFDLQGARPAPSLFDADLRFSDDVVREIRLGRHPQNTTRVVMDTEGVESFSVFTLYQPYRVIFDFRRGATAHGAPPSGIAVSTTGPAPGPKPAASAGAGAPPAAREPLPSRPVAPPALSAPEVPSVNSSGQFSLARQLGLGVARIVIDPGHGGHDPGARANGVNEAELVLDVSQRLMKLLKKQPGVEVVMTRESNAYVALEERTAIANREGADLFLSIHANASRNLHARGVETYFLNFATNPEAEAVAARENSASGQTMHSLPQILRAIALNNKLDESRDFARVVQRSMVQGLSGRNKQLRDLGVKQAPFVVLIGAAMPSVLAEISFLTNKQEGQLLKTSAYRQAIAQALFDAIVKYQRSLKARTTIAAREEL